ncbi:MAG: oxidoreductase [Thiotrichales bacterium]|nr:oxidoreductase [Thiotrichales bacterium]
MGEKVAFIGLGVMGYHMAGHLASGGHDVTVYNRTRASAEQWTAEHSGTIADTPAQAASGATFVMACVGNDDDVRAVTTGPDGAFEAMGADAVFVDHTTASAVVARELHAHALEAGFHFVDAPVSGGEAGAVNGQLSVMCGGDSAPYERAEPVIDCYAKICRRLGGSGAGQLTKMVNQICIAGLVQGLSEGLLFAEKSGLDINDVVEVISQGAAGSWQMVNRHETMAKDEFEFGFAVQWMRKDLDICMREAQQIGAPLPVTEIVDGYYADVQELGGNRWDTSSLIARLRRQ